MFPFFIISFVFLEMQIFQKALLNSNPKEKYEET